MQYIQCFLNIVLPLDFLGGSDDKASVYNAGDLGSIPGFGRSPGEGHGNPVQCSGLENLLDRGAWRAKIHGEAESDTTEQLTLSLHFRTMLQKWGHV